ncbi:hypothetical protein PM082_010580 [Marasmius tenuissimus]|nr:hypothetical protein PM082_010580 [Marasmius tenuissimus]
MLREYKRRNNDFQNQGLTDLGPGFSVSNATGFGIARSCGEYGSALSEMALSGPWGEWTRLNAFCKPQHHDPEEAGVNGPHHPYQIGQEVGCNETTMSVSLSSWISLPQPPNGFATWSQAGGSIPVPLATESKKANSQRIEIDKAYSQDLILLKFKNDSSDQQLAKEKMDEYHLLAAQLQALESRWSVRWSNSWKTKLGRKKRTLYQCGYDVDARQKQDAKTQRAQDRTSSDKKWSRRVPYDFTGCLGHVEVVENMETKAIERISGILKHNEACTQGVLARVPAVPVHEHVWEVALSQLANGASMAAIQETNQRMIQEKRYREMDTFNSETSNFRYILLSTDSSNLYAKYGRTLGIDVKTPPQYNISDWLDPSSTSYKPEVARAIFHYSERAEAGDRFEACISTPEMDEAAWKYAHHSQLVLDGTFGVCTVRLLLFIALAIDSNGKGLPIALFLFSAPTGNRATHAGYNTAILEKILREWKTHLNHNRPDSDSFAPYSAITDTDTKERGALLQVWPSIILLLCKFHVRQCWLNNRKKVLGGGSENLKNTFWKDHIRDQLRGLEIALLETVTHEQAQDLISKQSSYFDTIVSDNNTEATRAAQAGKKHLLYLNVNWMDIALWRSWSKWGRLTVASLLKIQVDGVVPTTNHLESFNGILKRKHLSRWFHSGHRLRFDFLILLLCTRILPGIYSQRQVRADHSLWLSERFKPHAGGVDLGEASHKRKDTTHSGACICWWSSDESRDQQARTIVSLNRITCQYTSDPSVFLGRVLSCKSNNVSYSLSLNRHGRASCSCLDFQQWGGACKHLRAMRLIIDHSLTLANAPLPFYPSSLDVALSVQEQVKLKVPTSSSSNPPPPESVTAFSAIQAVAQDHTGLDVEKEESEQGLEEDLDDLAGDLDESVYASFQPPPNLNEEQRRSINTQIEAKITHETSQILPRLHGLNNLLGDLPELGDSTDISELEEAIRTTQTRIQALRVATAASLPLVAAASEPERGRKMGQKRLRELRAPSNERRQKRHQSHSTT